MTYANRQKDIKRVIRQKTRAVHRSQKSGKRSPHKQGKGDALAQGDRDTEKNAETRRGEKMGKKKVTQVATGRPGG